ncbi:FKBP16-1 [Symbiodinium natans]|uniref:peptidylprolyl isomerase n=1 Tax=Symbiodinium natans TaxID=878477 RepID=A0A812JCZ7_9DINO|nr:FKBP16-1 [Symbiodinium natans]
MTCRGRKAAPGKAWKLCCFALTSAILSSLTMVKQSISFQHVQQMDVSRRKHLLLPLLGAVGAGVPKPARALVGSTLSPEIEEVVRVEPKGTDFQTLPSGLRILDLVVGKGDECCKEGDTVLVDWSLRKSNGYFVDASFGFDPGRAIDEKFGVGSPELRFTPLGDKGDKVIEGVRKALIGMHVGGTRRIIVPPNLGYVSDDLAPKPVDWGRQTQIQRAKNKNFVVELRLKALRQ